MTMKKKESLKDAGRYVDDRLKDGGFESYKIPWGQHFAGVMHDGLRPFWQFLGNMETEMLEDRMESQQTKAPVFVCGLARSGTTIMLELLHRTGGFATHLYKDYPFIDIPFLWNKWQDSLPQGEVQLKERAHMDGIMIGPDNPEAFEEMIWQHFFPDAHDEGQSAVFDQDKSHQKFERFYKDHLKKVMIVRGKGRYLSKGNYNLTRLGYLQHMFPDARFVIPVRNPVSHVASLIKQHDLFSKMEGNDKRALSYMKRVGHYEFGLDRRIINVGDDKKVHEIRGLLNTGQDIQGLALYWDMLHRWLIDVLGENNHLRAQVKIVDYEAFCGDAKTSIGGVFDFCDVTCERALLDEMAASVRAPDYYKHGFTQEELALISELTDDTYRNILSLSKE